MALTPERREKYLGALIERDDVSEAVILSTCNRTEIYVTAERFHGAYRDVRDLVSDLTYLPPDEFADDLEVMWDTEAAEHLFQVSAGLDSVVVGEHEILGQVRVAWEAAQSAQTCGPQLNLLFRHAVECGKRVRTDTAIARSVTSVSQAAVVMADDRSGGLGGRSVCIVGAGAMGRSMALAAKGAGAGRITIANRTARRAEEVAAEIAGTAAPLSDLHAHMVHADVVFSATGAAGAILTAAELATVLAERRGRPLVVVDIAVPRDIDPEVGEMDGVDLLDMNHLAEFCDRGKAQRAAEVPAVKAIVGAELERWVSVASSREVAPIIAELHSRADTLRQGELDRFSSRLGTLDDDTRELVEQITRATLAKLLHTPTVELKAAAGTPRGERLAAALQDLFGLDPTGDQ